MAPPVASCLHRGVVVAQLLQRHGALGAALLQGAALSGQGRQLRGHRGTLQPAGWLDSWGGLVIDVDVGYLVDVGGKWWLVGVLAWWFGKCVGS